MSTPDARITVLLLSARAENAFKRNGIQTLRELAALSIDQMVSLRGVGRTVAHEALAAITRYNRQFQLGPQSSGAEAIEASCSEVDAFVDAVLVARDHGFESTSRLLGRNRAELVVHGLSTATQDNIENGLNRWGIAWRPVDKPRMHATVTPTEGTIPSAEGNRHIVRGQTPVDEVRQAVLFLLNARESLRRTASCLLSYSGLTLGKAPTLQHLADHADHYGFDRPVTRERIRQVNKKAIRYIRAHSGRIRLGKWSAVVEETKGRTPLAPANFVTVFGFSAGGNAERQVAVLENWAEWLNLDWPFAVLENPTVGPLVVTKDSEETWGGTLPKIPREAGGSYVSVRTAAPALGFETNTLRKLLEASPKWHCLDTGGLYYSKALKLPLRDLGKTRNPLLTTLLRVFSVTERAWSAELAAAVVRARILRQGTEGIPDIPAEVIEAIAEQSGLLMARDGEVARAQVPTWNTLNEHDETLLRVYAEHGRTVSSDDLHTGLIGAGLSREVARATVAYSPFCVHIASGVGYKEGRYKSIPRIAEIQALLRTADQANGDTPQGNERPAIRVAVDARVRMTGECVLAEAGGPEGRWEIRDIAGNRIADVEFVSNRIVGLSPVLSALGIRRGGVLSLHRSGRGFRASTEHSQT